MDRFIDCLVDNDLTQLIIEGTATQDELQRVWDAIYVEYAQLSGQGSYNQVFEITKEINDLRAKITIVNTSVKCLQYSFDAEIVKILNSLALRCTINEEDHGETLINKLNSVIAGAKKWLPRLKQREKELHELRTTNTGKVDRNYFDEWLDVMSEVRGYEVESNKITVSRFCRSIVKINAASQKEQMKLKKR